MTPYDNQSRVQAKFTLRVNNSFGSVLTCTGVTFANGSRFDLVVIDHMEQRHNLPCNNANRSATMTGLRMAVNYRFSSLDELREAVRQFDESVAAVSSMDKISSFVRARQDAMKRIVATAEGEHRASLQGREMEFMVEKTIDVECFAKNDNSGIFDHDLNLMVCRKLTHTAQHHPYSFHGLHTGEQAVYRSGNFTGFVFDFVDNDKKYGPRFAYMNGRVVRIPTRQDPQMNSGIYVIMYQYDDKEGLTNQVSEYMPVEAAEHTFSLYKTHEEAETQGNPSHPARLEALKAHRVLTEEERRIEQLARDSYYDQTKLERTNSFEEWSQRRKDFYEDRTLNRKDHYDDRSHKRDDASALLRWGPGIVIGMAGVGAAAYQFMAAPVKATKKKK